MGGSSLSSFSGALTARTLCHLIVRVSTGFGSGKKITLWRVSVVPTVEASEHKDISSFQG